MLPKYNTQLLESIVCFTDILGFSNLVTQAPNMKAGNQLLNHLHATIVEQYFLMRVMIPHGHFKTFTDNVILEYPVWEDGEGKSGSVFMSVIDYQS